MYQRSRKRGRERERERGEREGKMAYHTLSSSSSPPALFGPRYSEGERGGERGREGGHIHYFLDYIIYRISMYMYMYMYFIIIFFISECLTMCNFNVGKLKSHGSIQCRSRCGEKHTIR